MCMLLNRSNRSCMSRKESLFMPPKIPKPCAYPNCPALTVERYCPKHKTVAGREYNKLCRSPDHAKHYDWRWRKIRNLYISAHPLCEECLKSNRLVPADEVHHIIPPDCGGTHDDDNLMSLCKSCHTKTRY